MRWARVCNPLVLVILAVASGAPSALAQDPPLRITSVQVGFAAAGKNEPPRFKLGLWTPIVVELQAATTFDDAALAVETTDSENVGTVFTTKVSKLNAGEKRTVVAYSRLGNSDGRFTLTVRDARGAILSSTSVSQQPLDLRENLFVTIGAALPELDEALLELRRARPETGEGQDRSDSWPRRAGHIANPDQLPERSLGYDAVDLLLWTTSNPAMNQRLLQNEGALGAIAGWVRQGGRLVVSISPAQQKAAAALLDGKAWQPPLPVTPPPGPVGFMETSSPRLIKVEEWAGITDKPFPAFGERPVPISWLLPGNVTRPDWRVFAETPEGRPLIAQMSYGRGQVTLLAFDIDREPFLSWDGRVPFLKAIASRLEPRIPQVLSEQAFGANQPTARDLATQLQTTLDQFDVATFKFGWVALLILGYILLVGPIDYFLLSRVFRRLEWTWLSFPLVVLTLSLLIFATIHGIKGEELRINQVDLVDFDLRTQLDAKLRPTRAHAYGNTWFTLLSPRIKSYTIGVQPNLVPGWFGGEPKEIASAEVVTWLGRPEYDGAAAMGRPRTQTFGTQRPYDYVNGATGLAKVPVPIWTTKSLMASWESPLPRLPFDVDLRYFRDKEVIVSGTIQSFLPADLHDAWIFFGPRAYYLEGPLKGGRGGGAVRTIVLDQRFQDIQGWPRRRAEGIDPLAFAKGPSDSTEIVKEMLFHELVDTGLHLRNHSFHRLDISWRVPEPLRARQQILREAILFARLASASGKIDALAARPDQPLPSLLWLGDVPGNGKTRPSVNGTLNQETYVRAFLPVRPAD
ncbi:MAG: hypothetical protein FJ271_05705 [Planctomycetes bacterium]|nr:hypothetical protein [Planctomycetota bacterium]